MGRDALGFIGLGIMGRPMAKNLLAAGFDLTVHSRSPSPIEELVAAGAKRASSPAEVAAASGITITMLPDTPDVESVLCGPDGVLGAVAPGSLVIDMSSIDPGPTRAIAEAFAVSAARSTRPCRS